MKKLVFSSLTAILVMAFSFGEAKAVDVADVVLALSFDDGKGEVAKDVSLYGNHGKLVNALGWVAGKFGTALAFDGATQKYVEVANEKNFDFERTDSFTIAAWVKLADKTQGDKNHVILCKVEGCHPTFVGFALYALTGEHGDSLALQLANSGDGGNTLVTSSTDIIDEKWHHVAAVTEGSSGGVAKGVKLYVDGKLEKMKAFLDDLGEVSILNDFPLRIGDRLLPGCGVPANGVIDEVLIIKKALSAVEVALVYQAGGISQVISAVQPQGKLATTWSAIKSDFAR